MRYPRPFNIALGILLLLVMGCVEDTVGIFRPDDLTRPATPTGLTATPTGATIHLAWNAVTDADLRGYNVYRSAAGDTSFARIVPATAATAYTDSSGLLAATGYRYTVTAVDSTGNESLPSNVVSATLVPGPYTLTMAINNAAWGQTNPSAGNSIHNAGVSVDITATPASGYRFVSWTGPVDNADAAQTSVTVNDNVTVTAIFEEVPAVTYDLTMQVNQNGWGTTSPAPGVHTYADGASVDITATPANGHRFVRWNGPVDNADAAETSVTVNNDATVTAIFEEIPAVTYDLTMQVNQNGWGTTSPAPGVHTYADGASVDITATPANGHRFVRWNGPVDDVNATKTTVNITADVTVTAVFEEVPPDTYVLTMETNVAGAGTTIPSAGTHVVTAGTGMTITAIPAAGYRFAGWNGTVEDPGSATTTVTLDGNHTVIAMFEKLNYQLTISAYRESWGAVTPEPGTHAYPAFTGVQISAIPAPGYRFVQWTGNVDDTGAASTSITLTQNESVTAIFEEAPPDTFTLTMRVNGTNRGATTPSVGAHDYQDGTEVTIVASPAEGYRFTGWTGTVADPNSATTTVTVTGSMTVTANFEKITRILTMAVVEASWGGTTPAVGMHSYDDGSLVQVSATPATGYRFVRWTGAVTDPNSVSTTVTLTQNETVTAVFEAIPPDMYVLTMLTAPVGWGTTLPAAGTHIYASGTVVNLTATPAEGFRFTGWTGAVASPSNPTTTITITAHQSVTANFEEIPPEMFVLTMAANPPGDGTTSPVPGGHQIEDGTIVPITATPEAGYRFVNWTGDTVADANSASTTITVDGDKSVTANFETITHTLTMAANIPGAGTITPIAGDHTYDEGTVVNISATPAAGYRFVNWTGAVFDDANSAATTVTVTGDLTVTANFVRQYTLTTATANIAQGTTNPAPGDHVYDTGTVVGITATPEAGFQFVNWTGAAVADANSASTTITVDGDKSVTANFVAITHTLTMAADPAGGGTLTPLAGDHTYDEGTVVNISATPAAGYRFVNWTGDVTDPNDPNTDVTVDAVKTVTANFVQQFTLTTATSDIAQGTTDPAPGDHVYDTGTMVNISAIPEDGYRFVNWTGAAVADANSASTTVTVTGDLTVTANFVQQFTLTTTTSDIAQGTTDPAPGDHVYDTGTVVDISAIPEDGYRFVNWTGAVVTDANSASTTITVDGDLTVTANFVAVFDLTMVADPAEGTTTPVAGVHAYDTGTVVDISAIPEDGYRFVNWTGDAVTDANSANTTVTVDAAKTVTANFVQQFTLTIATSDIARGTTDPAPGDHVYDTGTVVDISATPEAGSLFTVWAGDAVTDAGSAATTITMDGDKSVTATFVAE